MKVPQCLENYGNSLSYPGIVLATLFFSASLSPSLLPRPYILQALLSGVALACGYGIGCIVSHIWRYLELPLLTGKTQTVVRWAVSCACLIIATISVVYSSIWQNDLRELMGLAPNIGAQHLRVVAIALLLATVILLASRLLGFTFRLVAKRLRHVIPRKIANFLSIVVVLFIALMLSNKLVLRNILDAMDNLYSIADISTDSGVAKPSDHTASGSPQSLIPWDTIGRTGQNFVVTGPRQTDIVEHFNGHALKPLRVYAGLRSADTVEERAQLALAELIRIGGFERSKLIIATPTGTGWHDPSAVDSLEYLHRGDTAIITMQYSYLPSWLTLLVDPRRAKISANALYNVVYDYWSELPDEMRPDLYIYGLSLGSLAAETSIGLTSMLSDPIQGGVLAGPPFPSAISSHITKKRNRESTQWLPIIKDSSFIRFTNQDNALDIAAANWGPMRFVYIQYASDPMVFFSLDLWHREPDWLKGERAYDVSPALTWYPVVTFLQLLFDLPMADRMPRGNAHNYAAKSYIDAWIEVTQPPDWNDVKTMRLKTLFKGR